MVILFSKIVKPTFVKRGDLALLGVGSGDADFDGVVPIEVDARIAAAFEEIVLVSLFTTFGNISHRRGFTVVS